MTGTVDVGEGGNTITNITTAASGDQPDPSTAGDDLDESVVVDANADLVTEKTLLSGDATPAEGDSVTFQISVTNSGTAQATGVSLTDQLPAGITFTSSAVSQGSYNSATGLWTIGTLNESGVATIELTGTVDVGEGGNTITNITTAATGDQPDPSTVGDDLEEAVVVENIADLVTEKTLISGNATPNEGDSVTFQIAVTNNGAAQATNVSLVDQLPAGISFTGSSVSQGTYNIATGLWAVGTIDQGSFAVITLTGTVDVGQAGNTITNITTAATGDQTDPSTVGDDLDESVSPLVIADLGIAKSIVGEPVLTNIGNYVVTYEVVIENTGNVALADLSLLEDLQTQFGTPFVDAGNLTITVAPSNAQSNVSVDSAGWNGGSSIELIDTSSSSLLAIGDSFTIQFDVEIDPSQVDETLANQVEGSGDAVGSDGNPLTDSSGAPITVNDLSDSGVDATTSNPSAADDRGTSDDPTLFDPPPVPTGEISGVVFLDDNNDGIQQPGEAGIEGVQVVLTGTDVFGNPVNRTVLTDANGVYTFSNLQAGDYVVSQTQPEGFTDGIDINTGGVVAPVNDVLGDITLGFGETINTGSFGEQTSGSPGASGNPPQFSAFGPLRFNRLSNLANGFVSNSGTIYSGIPINGNGDPLSLDSGRPVTGGFALPAEELAGDECGCCEDPCGCSEAVDPCGNVISTEQIIDDGCGCGPVGPQGQMMYEEYTVEGTGSVIEDADSVSEANTVEGEESEDGVVEQIDEQRSEEMASDEGPRKPSFLKRLSSWLNV